MEVIVYKTKKTENLFLYVKAEEGTERVPEELIEKFGEMEQALSFVLTEDRKLAMEDTLTVIKNLNQKGYHLQMPPADERFNG
jgi:uncharacterized protein YcgL (UPF0745 family)